MTDISRTPMPARVRAAVAALFLAALLIAVPAHTAAAAQSQARPHVPAAPTAGGWQLPLPGSPTVLRRFDPPAEKWSAGHRGVDLAAGVGTDVLAAGPGVVAFAGQVAGRGVVTVRHGDLRSTYQPVRATVHVGAVVAAGQPIGTLRPDPHCGERACLHWGLLRGETYLDPMSMLRAGPARLVRVWGIPRGAPATASPTSGPTHPGAAATTSPSRGRSSTATPVPHDLDAGERTSSPASVGAAAAATAAVAGFGVAVGRRARARRGGPR